MDSLKNQTGFGYFLLVIFFITGTSFWIFRLSDASFSTKLVIELIFVPVFAKVASKFYEEYQHKLIRLAGIVFGKLDDDYFIRWNSWEFQEFVGNDVVDLRCDAWRLLAGIEKSDFRYSDYSFIVFPLAKAYEGVLKKILVRTGLVLESQLLEDPAMAISRYFNPAGNTAIFNELKDKARDKAIPFVIYAVFQECRNKIFHHDAHRDNRINSTWGARDHMEQIEAAIAKAYVAFK